jgi:hypothetical protein
LLRKLCQLLALLGALALTHEALAATWRQLLAPGADPGVTVPVLIRAAPSPAAMRVVVVNGSGCSGMGPIAERYFQGLESAQVWVLHKPGTRPWLRRSPDDCSDAFRDYDRHTRWARDATAAMQHLLRGDHARPTWVVGVSEGADLLPTLGAAVGDSLTGLVLLSATGLDPADTLRWQADRTDRAGVWEAIVQRATEPGDDRARVAGRSLGYWRDLLGWRLFDELTGRAWTVVHWWGDQDEFIPPEAHQAFVERAQGRPVRLCSRRWPGADHGLHQPGTGALQPTLWRGLLGGVDAACSGR